MAADQHRTVFYEYRHMITCRFLRAASVFLFGIWPTGHANLLFVLPKLKRYILLSLQHGLLHFGDRESDSTFVMDDLQIDYRSPATLDDIYTILF